MSVKDIKIDETNYILECNLSGAYIFVEKTYRLAKREDFNKVYRYGKSMANHQFVLYYLPQSKLEQFRLGISVSKKVGNAVVRNRLRRMIKEIVRLKKENMTPHYDYVLIARKPAAEMEYADMEKSILHVIRKASLYKKNDTFRKTSIDGHSTTSDHD
jgi:ribonuclease P protein component